MQDQTSVQGIHAKAFKVILVGAQSVGKSSILNRLCDTRFNTAYSPTIGIDFKTYQVEVGSKLYSLQIWDTAGQQKFRALTASYYKGAHGCVCVYDILDNDSLNACQYYVNKALEQNIPQQCIYLVANKSDLGQKLKKQGQEFAQQKKINFSLGSAKSGDGLIDLFNNLGCKMIDNFGGAVSTEAHTLKPKVFLTEKRNCSC